MKKTLKEQLEKINELMGKINSDYPETIELVDELLSEMALKLQHNKKDNELVVVSDLEDKRAAGNETFKSKEILKKHGFRWNGQNKYWYIDDTDLGTAKKAITQANRAEYIIDTLEDVEEFLKGANIPNGNFLLTKLEQYIEDLANATDERAADAEIRRWFEFFSNFHQYSFLNRILIYLQKPDAKKVAAFKTWKERHRGVKKGAKRIMITVPIFRKGENPMDQKDDENGGEKKKWSQPVGYTSGPVFDISDTYPFDERGEVPETPQWHDNNTPNETAEELKPLIYKAVENLGIKLTKTDARGGEKGYSAGGHINISSDVEGAAEASTLIHELAHELMHWRTKSKFYDEKEANASSALKELQAESVAFAVLKHYKIPAKHHATYLALWKANGNRIRENMEKIAKVSQFIIKQIDKAAAANPEIVKDDDEELVNELFMEMVYEYRKYK